MAVAETSYVGRSSDLQSCLCLVQYARSYFSLSDFACTGIRQNFKGFVDVGLGLKFWGEEKN